MTSNEGEPASENGSDARGVCPECGAVVEPFQEYCLVCGARLHETGSTGLAERWRQALPFTDKDWGWPILIALTIAVLASVFAILAVQSDKTSTIRALGPNVKPTTTAATTGNPQTTTSATTGNSSTKTAATTSDGGTGKTSTSPISTSGGLIAWPGPAAYTIVLASLPVSGGKAVARQKALDALRAGLGPDVGVLASSSYSSLHPGYYVIFSGVYTSQAEAQKHLSAARRAGFNTPYPKRVAS
ncbi:MAG: hypothetical protein ACYDHO_02930 [Gaiellaceae bacterium]